MWPLHVRTKEEYIRIIQTYVDREERAPLTEMLGQAFEDYREEEDFTAWCAGVAYGMELPDATTFLARFMETFPLSLHPVQVDWAEYLIWQGKLDDGSNEARSYLNRVQSAGLERYFEEANIVREGVSRAFLMLTAVYTEVGARSYSRRVIENAMLMHLEPFWQARFRSEIVKIESELQASNEKKLDRLWEGFFQGGENVEEVLNVCAACRVPLLSQRVVALSDRFTEKPEYRITDEEIFQMLYRTDKGAIVLI